MMLNPVLRREIQTSLRKWKVFAAIMLYVAALTAVAGCVFWTEIYNSYDFSFSPENISILYAIMAMMQLFLIIVIVPAITGGSINGEKERQTFDLLLVSKMKPVSIIIGKLLAGMGIVIIMIIASAPVFVITIRFGGASVKDVFLLMLYFILSALCVGSVSILFSALFKRSSVAMVSLYVLSAFLTIGTIAFFIIYADYYWMMNTANPPEIIYKTVMAINPLTSVLAVVDSQINAGIFNILSFGYEFGKELLLRDIWLYHIGLMVCVSIICIMLSVKAINPIKQRKRIRHRS